MNCEKGVEHPTEPNTADEKVEIHLIGRPTRDAADSMRKSTVLNMNDREMERLKDLLGC